jgi:UDP-2,4-diacetamido-2,4,6-trideoxy-beta-L-altropyranose hydrolase
MINKKAKDMVFVISAGSQYGMGHLMRCAVLARECIRRGMTVGFIMRGDASANIVLNKEVPFVDVIDWSDENIGKCKAGMMIFDTKLDINREIENVGNKGSKIVLIDRLSPDTDSINLFILPTVYADIPEKLSDRVLSGPEYVIISEVFTGYDKTRYSSEDKNIVLIALGGSDPLNSTSKVMDACYQFKDMHEDMKVKVIIGPANSRAEYIEEKAVRYGMDFVLYPDQKTYRNCLLQALFVIAGFGISVYEIAYLKIPCLYVTHFREDFDNAKKLERLGLGMLLGYGPDISVADIKESCMSAFSNRDFLRKGIQGIFDGKGAERIVDKLIDMGGSHG